jgi:hypothetical protein
MCELGDMLQDFARPTFASSGEGRYRSCVALRDRAMPSTRTRRVRPRQHTVKPSNSHIGGRNKCAGGQYITVDDGARWARDMRAGIARTQQERALLAAGELVIPPSSPSSSASPRPKSMPASDKLRSLLRSMQILDGIATPILPPGTVCTTAFDHSLIGSELPTSVVRAMRTKRLTPIRAYLDLGGDINAVDNQQRSLVHWAACTPFEVGLAELLRRGADVDVTQYQGATSLYLCTLVGHEKAMGMLLNAKADCNIPDEKGITPMMLASWIGNTRALRLLISHGAKPEVRDDGGQTALSYALKYGRKGACMVFRSNFSPQELREWVEEPTALQTALGVGGGGGGGGGGAPSSPVVNLQ